METVTTWLHLSNKPNILVVYFLVKVFHWMKYRKKGRDNFLSDGGCVVDRWVRVGRKRNCAVRVVRADISQQLKMYQKSLFRSKTEKLMNRRSAVFTRRRLWEDLHLRIPMVWGRGEGLLLHPRPHPPHIGDAFYHNDCHICLVLPPNDLMITSARE